MKSWIRRSLSDDGQLLMVTVEATEIVQEILEKSKALPSAMIHLGQASIGAALMQGLTDTKENETVELQWRVDGPFGNLTANAFRFGGVRVSIANSQVLTSTLDMSLGQGIFSCRKVKNHQLSSGIIESTGHVSRDIEEYFLKSEQKYCAVGLSVKLEMNEGIAGERPYFVSIARGYLIHFLPEPNDVNEKRMALLDAHLRDLGPLSQWVLDDDPERATLTMARFITANQGLKAIENSPLELQCQCTPEKVMSALKLLSSSERDYLIEKDKIYVEVTCEFCGKRYQVLKKDILSSKVS